MKFALILAKHFHPILKAAGFLRTAQHWHKSNDDVIQVVNLQQSRWGNWTYVNCGIHLKRTETLEKPKGYECDIWFRLENIIPGELGRLVHGELHDLLSENPTQPNESDALGITEALEKYGIPYLAQFETLEKIKKLTKFAFFRRSMTSSFAKILMEKKSKIQLVQK